MAIFNSYVKLPEGIIYIYIHIYICANVYMQMYTPTKSCLKKNSSYNYIITICLISTPSTNIYI